jgi:PhzF family phenazine biosynthesis protein
MRELQYQKIDAFTDGISSGNPAGVVLLNPHEELTAAEMQQIAKTQKGIVSEVAFCTPIDSGLYSLKYYSSECEVDFCGHATIACMYELIKNNPSLLNLKTVMIKTNKGALPVTNDIGNSDSVFITAPVPEYFSCGLLVKDIAQNLNIPENTIAENQKISIINGGLKTLIVPISSLREIVKIQPDQMKLRDLCIHNNIDIVLVFCLEVSNRVNRFRTRVFAPKFGYLEDPATGSGNAAFGYYLLKNKIWDGESLSLEQGPSLAHPNIVKLKTVISDGIQRVLFGGNATVKYIKQLSV